MHGSAGRPHARANQAEYSIQRMSRTFGLCFLHLRNVKGFGWNHKRVYRIYRELELNMRIKPRKAAATRET